MFNGTINNSSGVNVNFDNYKCVYIEVLLGEYVYTLLVPKQMITSDFKKYWTSAFLQNATSQCSMAFSISLTQIKLAFLLYNGSGLAEVSNVHVYGIN